MPMMKSKILISGFYRNPEIYISREQDFFSSNKKIEEASSVLQQEAFENSIKSA